MVHLSSALFRVVILLLLLVLCRYPKLEPKPWLFSETEPKLKCSFWRPNGRFAFGGSACIVPVTDRSVVIVSIICNTRNLWDSFHCCKTHSFSIVLPCVGGWRVLKESWRSEVFIWTRLPREHLVSVVATVSAMDSQCVVASLSELRNHQLSVGPVLMYHCGSFFLRQSSSTSLRSCASFTGWRPQSRLHSNMQSSCISVFTGVHLHTLLTSFVRW